MSCSLGSVSIEFVTQLPPQIEKTGFIFWVARSGGHQICEMRLVMDFIQNTISVQPCTSCLRLRFNWHHLQIHFLGLSGHHDRVRAFSVLSLRELRHGLGILGTQATTANLVRQIIASWA